MLASSKFFGKFPDVIGPHRQVKRPKTYIYSEKLLAIISFLQDEKNYFSFGEIEL